MKKIIVVLGIVVLLLASGQAYAADVLKTVAATETPGSAGQSWVAHVAFGAVFALGFVAAFIIMRRAYRRS